MDVSKLSGFENARVWRGTDANNHTEYVGLFNLADEPVTLKASWAQLGLTGTKRKVQDLWADKAFKSLKQVEITLPAHGSTVFQVK